MRKALLQVHCVLDGHARALAQRRQAHSARIPNKDHPPLLIHDALPHARPHRSGIPVQEVLQLLVLQTVPVRLDVEVWWRRHTPHRLRIIQKAAQVSSGFQPGGVLARLVCEGEEEDHVALAPLERHEPHRGGLVSCARLAREHVGPCDAPGLRGWHDLQAVPVGHPAGLELRVCERLDAGRVRAVGQHKAVVVDGLAAVAQREPFVGHVEGRYRRPEL
mmetsp:Transcript_2573/g.6284  ORF Transcript_2573/g.6284 Transcript_2573/m.6284 type:complete len:219 (+) Transcript_2573:458-1114(+)